MILYDLPIISHDFPTISEIFLIITRPPITLHPTLPISRSPPLPARVANTHPEGCFKTTKTNGNENIYINYENKWGSNGGNRGT